jgi:NitT/TauT family transport system substrate-binding protein
MKRLCSLAILAAITGTAHAQQPTQARVLMNWFAQADQSGYWQAQAEHLGAGKGIEVVALQGGPKIQTIPQVAAGQAEFGVANADDVLLARLRGAPVKAVFVSLDHVPYNLVYHPDPNVKTLSDLKGKTFAVSIGFAYWEWLKKQYALGRVHEIPVTGDLTMFRTDPDMVTQGYSITMPFRLQAAGIPYAQFKVPELGYRPYDVLFTTDDMLAQHHDFVVAALGVMKQGWADFITDPSKANTLIVSLNKLFTPDMEDKAVAEIKATELPSDPTKIGCMTDARWQELTKQLQDVNFLPADFDPAQAYDKTLVPGC